MLKISGIIIIMDNIVRQWYLVYTKPKKEAIAKYNLQRQGFEIFLPLIQQERRRRGRWVKVIEPLFPSYLFIRLKLGHDNLSSIRSTIGVRGLVRFSEEPAVVPESIVTSLKLTVDESSGLYRGTTPAFSKGDMVVIERGALAGIHAIVSAETGEGRVTILFKMLGRENRAIVDRDALCLA